MRFFSQYELFRQSGTLITPDKKGSGLKENTQDGPKIKLDSISYIYSYVSSNNNKYFEANDDIDLEHWWKVQTPNIDNISWYHLDVES